ncbi:MAG: cysteine--tRNA ligase [Candidatus Kerfeldbacteria bacterium CG15_BIG_FIL_POST_REV_8_21_14_020_45_12]|uniref:Cysteine--tRNA ligase n=1 Tax=Candidatus Kerfeldbacteria bacterium CG15_BIG_FIL_POST_REV_8_21_14_020_45_12 TaxID=2014247 RepID=A0A2M7H3V8_9BACT|nr:MAG: cysteine--tRNA ligase [Candidatus Kerfeldbacteria bacterium CG15_BIG_FIL_POST_REV_8_21_14_020_45_12]PJA92994.1 MAG: cysteine--tRNA ligase [Candidatus Kerfeldbacteria bacterium CG_4_9_14_3_um_filter_45_8]
MKLYNSLTRSKEEFTPAKPDYVTLYTCGPTVYDYAHIGNLRTFLFYDILRRALQVNGYDVNHVMNITDVGHLTDDADAGDDKMEKGAAREGKTVWQVAQFYEEAFHNDIKRLNILPASQRPRATEHIPEQIELVKQLEAKGYTYATSDGIYFDTSKFPDYGKMARLDISGLQEGARVEKSIEKHHPTDFALWKLSPTDSKRAMEWESPWGTGFPGWHLECSAMAMKYLGKTLDIHTGGVDHMPVHHTNEIAQSEAVTDQPFARWWMHGEFLLINDGRMGKSVGNFITLSNLIDKGFNPLAYRYFALTAHYRSKLNFSWETLDKSQHAYNKLVYLLSTWDEPASTGNADSLEKFHSAINDDLNLPEAMAALWEVVKSNDTSAVKAITIFEMDKILGLDLMRQSNSLRERLQKAGKKMDKLIGKREEARTAKDYTTADELRDKIAKLGFAVDDTEDGPVLKPIDDQLGL